VLRSVQRGMLRHVFLVVDASRAMEATDFKPSRAAVALALAKASRAASACNALRSVDTCGRSRL
jgi:uncharacterized protein (DUF58 family)